jgi:hypothetical protein
MSAMPARMAPEGAATGYRRRWDNRSRGLGADVRGGHLPQRPLENPKPLCRTGAARLPMDVNESKKAGPCEVEQSSTLRLVHRDNTSAAKLSRMRYGDQLELADSRSCPSRSKSAPMNLG